MKIINVNREEIRLHSIADLAKAVGKPLTNVWYAIRQTRAVAAPDYRWGNRDYYTDQQYATALAAFRQSATATSD
ncbi:hypothetical protein [Zavarzinella formosa]|uniref:hypothetical protein n=1 Tax=Zavarzinella formosa TaxID=360055 RepID=UPI0002DCF28F|nr:hypothetical protein [Zavarzinella formosa]